MQKSLFNFGGKFNPIKFASVYYVPSAKMSIAGGQIARNQNLNYDELYNVNNLTNVDYTSVPEIEGRIRRVLSHFDKVDLRTFEFRQDLTKDLGLDSLERVALIASIEHEFKYVFEDNVFDNFKRLDQVVAYLAKDHFTQ